MFKRIGATILTIVMLLTMASVISSAQAEGMTLDVSLVDGDGNPLEYVLPEDEVYAIVNIKDPVALSGMAIVGSYSTDIFAANGEPQVVSPKIDGVELNGQLMQDDKNILAGWFAEANVALIDGQRLITVPLKVKAEAALGDAEISFSFYAKDMYIEQDGKPVALPAENFSAKAAIGKVTIVDTPPAPPVVTTLAVDALANAQVGDIITVKVNVKNYANNWSAMTIKGTYDADKLELQDDIVPTEFDAEGSDTDAVIEKMDGKLAVTWASVGTVAKGEEFTALTLKFKVKKVGDAELFFSFKENGIYGADSNTPLTSGFSTTLAKKVIAISPSVDKTKLNVTVVQDSAKVGQLITVKVDVENYFDNWAVMTIAGLYDDGEFELINVKDGGFTDGGLTEKPAYVDQDGKFGITWINDNTVTKGTQFNALELTFRVTKEGDGKGKFEFFFVPEGILNAEGEKVPANTVDNTKAFDELILLANDTQTYLTVSVDETAYVGKTVTVTVNVNDYLGLWSSMGIQGKYDTSKLKIKEINPIKFQLPAEEEAGAKPIITDENGNLLICWYNTEAVTMTESFPALEIVFTVEKEGTANFAFSFWPDGILDGETQKVPAEWYNQEEKTASVDLRSLMAQLEVSAAPDRVKIGDTVTYTVNIKDYQDNWMGMGILAKYNASKDAAKLKFIKATSSIGKDKYEYFEAAETKPGTIKMAWANGDPVDLGKNVEAVTLVFEAIAEGDAEVSFEFPNRGIISKDPITNEEGYAPADTFSQSPVSESVTVFIPTALEFSGEDSVVIGEEYTATLNLKEYKDCWSGFNALWTYDAGILGVKDFTPHAIGGVTPLVDTSVAGEIRVSVPAGAANIDAEEENAILTVTFVTKNPADTVFNATLAEVLTFDDAANVPADSYEYKVDAEAFKVKVEEVQTPYLYMVLEKGNSMDEGTDGVLKLYLDEYTSEWCCVPVVLNFDTDLIRIKEDEMVVSPLGEVAGDALVRVKDGKIVFTWISDKNIEADDDPIEIASIPFRAYQDGTATFSAEFSAESVVTPNGQGGFDVVDSDTYVLKAEDQVLTINYQFDNSAPMYLAVGAASSGIKNKKDSLALTINNFSSRVQALSVKLYYDKDKVTIKRSDIDPMNLGRVDVTGAVVLNEDEGYIHFIWISAEHISDEATLTLANIAYTPNVVGQIDFRAEIDLALGYDEITMDPIWDYVESSETVTVDIKAQTHLTAIADKTDIKIGDTVTVTVSVNEYAGLWSAMTINGSYNKELLRLVGCEAIGAFGAGDVAIDAEEGTIKAEWANGSNVAASNQFEAMVLTFKARDGGIAEFNFALQNVVTNGDTLLVPEQDYAVDALVVDQIDIEICNHSWSSNVTHMDGTAGEASKHIQICTKGCGAEKETKCTLSKRYSDPTCDKAGTITYKCSVCRYNETLNNPAAPALGHKYAGKPVHKNGTQKHVSTCLVCGTVKEEACSFRSHVVAPTCIKDGYTVNVCTACDYSFNSNIVKAKGEHGALILHYIAPTVTANGSIVTQCDTCREYVTPPYAGAVKKTLKAGHPFPDVQEPSMWFYDAVNFSKAFEIFGGDELGNFNPDANITRGQLVTVLGRIIKAEAEKTMTTAEFNAYLKAQTSKVSGMSSTTGFTDLNGKYYERYAKLFAKWGIVNGYPDGTFGGDKNITREEMATLIKRFVEAYGADVNTIKFGKAATFRDFSKVSGWAKANVQWVGKVGLFQGDTNKNYNPQSNATRAEIAVVIYRMLPVLKNICLCDQTH